MQAMLLYSIGSCVEPAEETTAAQGSRLRPGRIPEEAFPGQRESVVFLKRSRRQEEDALEWDKGAELSGEHLAN